MEYLGSLGRLVGFRCASTERVGSEPRYSVRSTVEGRRRAQIVPASPRTWDVTWGARTNPDIAALSAFVSGAWGAGPWHWVPVQAQRGNLLTPREALLMERANVTGVADGPPMLDADGAWFPRSLNIALPGTAATFVRDLPVIPGGPVTFTADVERRTGAPGLSIGFYNEAGAAAGVLLEYGEARSGVQRVSVSGVVPGSAASMAVGVHTNTGRLTRPQVTWTDGPVPYSAGHGCRAAIVDGMSEDLIVAHRSGTYSSVGFTVMEVS